MLAEAANHLTQALHLAIEIEHDQERCDPFAYCGLSSSLPGDVTAADHNFAQANVIGTQLYQTDLFSIRGINWAEHLIRTSNESRARQLPLANSEVSERNGWKHDIARCRWLLGWLDTLAGEWLKAHSQLDDAKSVFTGGHMIHDLARTLLTECLGFVGEGQLDATASSRERVLDLAAPRNYRLVHADALNLRARIAAARNDRSTAREDAEAALQIAQPREYAWAQRDSVEILASAYRTMGDENLAYRYQQQFEDWRRRLTA